MTVLIKTHDHIVGVISTCFENITWVNIIKILVEVTKGDAHYLLQIPQHKFD